MWSIVDPSIPLVQSSKDLLGIPTAHGAAGRSSFGRFPKLSLLIVIVDLSDRVPTESRAGAAGVAGGVANRETP